ncbi:hypothetical protein ACSLVQ_29505, partial [Klebsiella pneumoniae]|uniref:hypothetical protein n=1 Tax=Klebsiella pneumoniae TaxID=573 RepID=UPI003EDF3DB8
SLMEQSSKIAKEIWILENQGLAAYLMDLADSGVQAKHNDSQLWVAYCLGIAPKPESDLVVSSVAPLPDVDSDIAPTGREDVIE